MADAATITTHGTSLPDSHRPTGQSTRRAFLTATAALTPALAVAALPMSAARAAPGADAPILSAWQRYVAAYAMINSDAAMADDLIEESDRSDDPYRRIASEAEALIQRTTAQTPRGVEVQLWTALHTSGGLLRDDEAAILRMDARYLQQNHHNFDWNVLPLLAVIQSLRSMGDKA